MYTRKNVHVGEIRRSHWILLKTMRADFEIVIKYDRREWARLTFNIAFGPKHVRIMSAIVCKTKTMLVTERCQRLTR